MYEMKQFKSLGQKQLGKDNHENIILTKGH